MSDKTKYFVLFQILIEKKPKKKKNYVYIQINNI